jgi:hypothetical protein
MNCVRIRLYRPSRLLLPKRFETSFFRENSAKTEGPETAFLVTQFRALRPISAQSRINVDYQNCDVTKLLWCNSLRDDFPSLKGMAFSGVFR